MKLKFILFAAYSVVIVLLLASVIHSGYSYVFDPDELFHINVVFLLRHGLMPYRDFFTTYTPLFHWFLMPVSFLTGFTFRFLETSRIAMIVLFIIRLILIFLIVRKLFGSLVAYIFVPLYLYDPFTVFSGMQVRPDNLMMTLYAAGILLMLHWYLHKITSALPWAGLLLGTSALVLLKNIPATLIVILFIFIELMKTRSYRIFIKFIIMTVLPVVCFALWALYHGILPFMVQQIVVDAKQLNDLLLYPENILNYYWPPNFVLYGYTGRPLTWAYELCLPLIAFAGIFTVFLDIKSFDPKRKLIGWFTTACLLQWASLLFVRSVFIQYFLSVSWFLTVFAAYAFSRVYKTIGVKRIYRQVISVLALLLLIGGFVISWKANNTRAVSSYAAQKSYLEAQWHSIPETSSVFPGTLFRKNIYPIGYGWNFADFSSYFVKRYGSPSVYLARYRIPYVVIDPYNFSSLDAQTQEYIRAHYNQNPNDQNMWILRS